MITIFEYIKRLIIFFKKIHVVGTDNRINILSKKKKNFKIKILGNNNIVDIGKDCLLSNTKIIIDGSNNKIVIENNVRFWGPCKIYLYGNSILHIKSNTGVRGVEFNLNNANIIVGEQCMFGYGILLRNHDSHKVIDLKNNIITNHPKDIILGKHIWIAQNVTILKGSSIGDNSIIGLGSVVTKGCSSGSILAGNPAKVVKENISWEY